MKIFNLSDKEKDTVKDRLVLIDNILNNNLSLVISKLTKSESDYADMSYIGLSKLIINSALIIFTYETSFVSLQFKLVQLRTLLELLAISRYILRNPGLAEKYLEEAQLWQDSVIKSLDGSGKMYLKTSRKKLKTFNKKGLVEDELNKLSPIRDKEYLYNIFSFCSIFVHAQDLTIKYLISVSMDERLMIVQSINLYHQSLFTIKLYMDIPTSKLSSQKNESKKPTGSSFFF